MTCPTNPPVHDSALAICQPRLTSCRPSRRAAATSSSSVGGRVGGIGLAVVRELEGDRVVEPSQIGNDRLEVVFGLGRDADRVALDIRFCLGKGLPNSLRELLCLL